MNSKRSRLGGSKIIKLNKRVQGLIGLAVIVPCLVIPTAASAKTKLYGSGSSAAEPEMQALFAAYQKTHKVQFVYNPDGGNAGVTDVSNGYSEFAVQTAAPSATTHATLWGKLFLDALCIDVNSKNKLSSLTIPELAGIFSNKAEYTTWGQVPGFKASSGVSASSTILEEGRNSAAGQFTFFQQTVLDGGKENSSVSQLQTDGQMKVTITSHKTAIGYVGLANSSAKNEKALKIAAAGKTAYGCTAANVKSEKYPLWRWDWVVLPAHPNAQVLAFFQWVTDSSAAAKIINKAGGVGKVHKLSL